MYTLIEEIKQALNKSFSIFQYSGWRFFNKDFTLKNVCHIENKNVEIIIQLLEWSSYILNVNSVSSVKKVL